jgi:trk system potassium uptake protein TrkA
MPKKRFVVVGLGNFGFSVATSLREMGHAVVALDTSREKVEKIANVVERAIVGDATEPRVLEEVGAGEADAGIVSTGRDITASVLTTLALRDLGIDEIYVKVISDLHARILDKVGVAETIFPEREAAQLLAKRAASRSVLKYVELGPGFSVEELVVRPEWIGKTLRQLELRRRFEVSVVAVRDYLSESTRPVPDPDAPLKDSDTLFVAGTDEALAKLVD